MKQNASAERPKTIGLSLLFTVFLVLSLITFAAISLIEAKHDLDQSQKAANRITAYQEACNRAEERLDTLQAEAALPGAKQEISYTEPIDEQQALSVVLVLDEVKKCYTIKTWKTVTTKQWQMEETIPNLFTFDDTLDP